MVVPRHPSVKTYLKIKEEGLLSSARFRVYEALYQLKLATAKEIDQFLGTSGMWKRCSELRDRGVAMEVGERVCKVSGQTVTVWGLVDQLPQELPTYTYAIDIAVLQLDGKYDTHRHQGDYPTRHAAVQKAMREALPKSDVGKCIPLLGWKLNTTTNEWDTEEV